MPLAIGPHAVVWAPSRAACSVEPAAVAQLVRPRNSTHTRHRTLARAVVMTKNSAATGINNQGHVIGWSAVGPDFSHAFVWDGAMQDLGTVGDGRAEVVPNAINARGQIVGYESDFPNILRAVMWDSGVLRDLGTLGDQELPVAIA